MVGKDLLVSKQVEVKVKTRSLWLILLIVAYSAWSAKSVLAHAVLLRSNPPANAVLVQSPIQVELFFSETLEPQLSSITVIDSENRVVDAGDVRVDPAEPTRMTVSLHSLADGIYTVSWEALSTIDGHQTVGSFPFAVGDVDVSAIQAIQQSSTAQLPFTALLSKFMLLSALTVLVGQRLFLALIWESALKSGSVSLEKPAIWGALNRYALIICLVAIGLGILSQAGQVTGNELSSPFDPRVGQILTETRLGVIWLVRLLLVMLAVWLLRDGASGASLWIGFLANLGLLFTVTLTSHAATEGRPLFPMLGDWLHLIGMTFWFGGLLHLITGIRHLRNIKDLPYILITLVTSRFSFYAIGFVLLLGLTGFYSAYLRVGSWSALWVSLYGHVLLVKQVFVAGLLIIAALNLFIISPRLKQGKNQDQSVAHAVMYFQRTLVLEITLAILLLASVSFLTYIPPAKPVTLNPGIEGRQQVDDLKLNLAIQPGRVGQNTFSLKLATTDGQPVQTAKAVLLRFTSSQPNLPPSELQLIGQGDGTFLAKGAYLSLPGAWQVQAIVRRTDKFDTYANFNFDLKAHNTGEQVATALRQSGVLFLMLGLTLGWLSISVRQMKALRWSVGLPMSVWMVGLGIFFLTNIQITENVLAGNPIPPNAQSITAGQQLFAQYCAPCHGAAGLGDGPVGLTLNPRPADLTQHAIAGVHSDAQLYEWITYGFPGSQMPPFKATLTDTDRWHLVNFIRTLAPK